MQKQTLRDRSPKNIKTVLLYENESKLGLSTILKSTLKTKVVCRTSLYIF